jgi:hypothetical protein
MVAAPVIVIIENVDGATAPPLAPSCPSLCPSAAHDGDHLQASRSRQRGGAMGQSLFALFLGAFCSLSMLNRDRKVAALVKAAVKMGMKPLSAV